MNPCASAGELTRELHALCAVPGAVSDVLLREAERSLERQVDERLLAALLEAAALWRDWREVRRILERFGLPETKACVSPAFRLLSASLARDAERVRIWFERVRMGGPLRPEVAEVVARALVEAGSADLAAGVLSQYDARSAGATAVARFHRLCREAWLIPAEHGRQSSSSGSHGAAISAWPAVRVWLTGSVTLAPLVPGLEVGLLTRGFRPTTALGDFGTMHQDLRDPAGRAAQFQPDFVAVCCDAAHLVPDLVRPRRDFADIDGAIERGVWRLGDSVRAWRAASQATVLLHTVLDEDLRRVGFCDRLMPDGAQSMLGRVNGALAALCQELPGCHLVDLLDVVFSLGGRRFADHRRRLYGRFPASADAMATWGLLLADFINVLKRGPRKVVVCDLDNTIWGGIVGDVGPAGVQVGPDYPGNAYLEFQRVLLDLNAQGILLALCSKNDPETALAVFRSHEQMAVRLDDIAAYRIGWSPKPQSLRELAEELNLGLNSFVFLDDSAHERADVRRALPDVLVPELPADPAERPAFVRAIRDLWPAAVTESDAHRAELYRAQRKREQLQAQAGSVAGFLKALDQVLTVGPAAESDVSRVAQMHQRTNQFNVTTRRYDEVALRARRANGALVLAGWLKDCFGDQGIVITAVVVPEGGTWRLDTFLMSCRVMGRTVEQAFIGYIVEQAKRCGVKWIEGEFIPTERNGPVAGVYQALGFAGPETRPATPASCWWRLEVDGSCVPPAVVTVREGRP